ncbi:MAG TPA: hypothetical protein VFY20_04310 [Gemmatimonadales bacterium]|nr:hypothetical protein [Gemmatimonadales bacterium]
MTMRKAVTASERLQEAREELRLYRWLCDVTLAVWRPAAAVQPVVVTPRTEPEPAGPWPLWQPAWHHERCRPVVLKA